MGAMLFLATQKAHQTNPPATTEETVLVILFLLGMVLAFAVGCHFGKANLQPVTR